MAVADFEQLPSYEHAMPSGYEALMRNEDFDANVVDDVATSIRNPTYGEYMHMHKILVGNKGARQLKDIYDDLRGESRPVYLSTAGWAAVEAALVQSDIDTEERMTLLRGGVDCWLRALRNQKWLNLNPEVQEAREIQEVQETQVKYALPYRIALDIAVSPLLEGTIQGEVTSEHCRRAFEDCLNIAQANAACIRTLSESEDKEGLPDHAGFGYECNALLAFNRRLSETWFAIPSSERSDDGVYNRKQTHDLSIIHQKWGAIYSATPVEVKSCIKNRDRRRYRALLVGGKMHLSLRGQQTPEHTLSAIAASYDGTATEQQWQLAEAVSNDFVSLVKKYHTGNMLGRRAVNHIHTLFRTDANVELGQLAMVRSISSS